MRRALLVLLALIMLLCCAPLISGLMAHGMARFAGCNVLRGHQQACLVFDRDIGPTLTRAAVLGWTFLATGPIAVICLVALLALGAGTPRR